MKYELASIPKNQTDRISGFVEGAKKMLEKVSSDDDWYPRRIDVEFRKSGNCHIFLQVGDWRGDSDVPYFDPFDTVSD